MTIYAEKYIGECAAGSCDRPATVRVFEDYLLCALHDHRYRIGQEIDAAVMSLGLVKRWRSEAQTRMHGGTEYLVRLFDRAKEDLDERLTHLEGHVDVIDRIDHENFGTHDLRIVAKASAEGQEEPEAAQSSARPERSWEQVLVDAVVQLDTAAADREEEGREDISSRIREVISALEDELERLTGEEIPRPIRRAREHAAQGGLEEGDAPESEANAVLSSANLALSEAADHLQTLRPEYFGDQEAYWQARQQIAAAGRATAELKRGCKESPDG